MCSKAAGFELSTLPPTVTLLKGIIFTGCYSEMLVLEFVHVILHNHTS